MRLTYALYDLTILEDVLGVCSGGLGGGDTAMLLLALLLS